MIASSKSHRMKVSASCRRLTASCGDTRSSPTHSQVMSFTRRPCITVCSETGSNILAVTMCRASGVSLSVCLHHLPSSLRQMVSRLCWLPASSPTRPRVAAVTKRHT